MQLNLRALPLNVTMAIFTVLNDGAVCVINTEKTSTLQQYIAVTQAHVHKGNCGTNVYLQADPDNSTTVVELVMTVFDRNQTTSGWIFVTLNYRTQIF